MNGNRKRHAKWKVVMTSDSLEMRFQPLTCGWMISLAHTGLSDDNPRSSIFPPRQCTSIAPVFVIYRHVLVHRTRHRPTITKVSLALRQTTDPVVNIHQQHIFFSSTSPLPNSQKIFLHRNTDLLKPRFLLTLPDPAAPSLCPPRINALPLRTKNTKKMN